MADGDVIGYNASRMRIKRAKERAARTDASVWTVLKPSWPLARLGTTVRIDTGSAVGPTDLSAVCFLRSSSRTDATHGAPRRLRTFSNVARTSRHLACTIFRYLSVRARTCSTVRHKAPLWLAMMIYQRESARGCSWKSSINENLSPPDPIEIGEAVLTARIKLDLIPD